MSTFFDRLAYVSVSMHHVYLCLYTCTIISMHKHKISKYINQLWSYLQMNKLYTRLDHQVTRVSIQHVGSEAEDMQA